MTLQCRYVTSKNTDSLLDPCGTRGENSAPADQAKQHIGSAPHTSGHLAPLIHVQHIQCESGETKNIKGHHEHGKIMVPIEWETSQP